MTMSSLQNPIEKKVPVIRSIGMASTPLVTKLYDTLLLYDKNILYYEAYLSVVPKIKKVNIAQQQSSSANKIYNSHTLYDKHILFYDVIIADKPVIR